MRTRIEGGLSHSIGIRHVLVLGEAVVRDGESVDGVTPGQAIVGRPGRRDGPGSN